MKTNIFSLIYIFLLLALLTVLLLLLVAGPAQASATEYTVSLPVLFGPDRAGVGGRITFAGEVITDQFYLALCEVILDTLDRPWCVYDYIGAPRTTVDETGAFWFSQVEPGWYGLVMVIGTAMDAIMPHWPDTGQPILFVVVPGYPVDLGLLDYDDEYPFYPRK